MSIDGINKAVTDYSAASSSTVKVNIEPKVKDVEKVEPATSVKADNKKKDSSDLTITEKARESESRDQSAAEAVKKAVEEMNRNNENKTVQFGIHEKTGRITIKILDKETKNVVKEFPAEKTLDLIAKAWEMAGMMVDEKR